ncbi:hypothetical protein [Mycobacterium marinum]|uniref:hypothetical protein n=1 Tax=Mycobacterium marinum TaxID=1781 RepID=UPI00235A3B07|nr:hypothetical protein [Mycobacterium marinum]MDC8985574.1 hypothetical protein [Mycobacterium marinum]MDC9013602.1 hypothetical protein [Mycobacterium marinum]MDC9018960.1 hypothetical protein [Mycobacterium marinum]
MSTFLVVPFGFCDQSFHQISHDSGVHEMKFTFVIASYFDLKKASALIRIDSIVFRTVGDQLLIVGVDRYRIAAAAA